MKDERIEAVYDWLEPQLIQNIQVFLGFANSYQQFIQDFSRITTPLTSILKTTVSDLLASKLGSIDKDSTIKVEVGNSGDNEISIANQTKSAKSKNVVQLKELETGFFTSRTKLIFAKLRQTFIKAPILHYFDPQYHIWIKTNILGHAIDGVLS